MGSSCLKRETLSTEMGPVLTVHCWPVLADHDNNVSMSPRVSSQKRPKAAEQNQQDPPRTQNITKEPEDTVNHDHIPQIRSKSINTRTHTLSV